MGFSTKTTWTIQYVLMDRQQQLDLPFYVCKLRLYIQNYILVQISSSYSDTGHCKQVFPSVLIFCFSSRKSINNPWGHLKSVAILHKKSFEMKEMKISGASTVKRSGCKIKQESLCLGQHHNPATVLVPTCALNLGVNIRRSCSAVRY